MLLPFAAHADRWADTPPGKVIMHKHSFMLSYEYGFVCESPACSYRFSLKEVKQILSDVANGEAAQQSVQADDCPQGGRHKFQVISAPSAQSMYLVQCEKCGHRR